MLLFLIKSFLRSLRDDVYSWYTMLGSRLKSPLTRFYACKFSSYNKIVYEYLSREMAEKSVKKKIPTFVV